MTRRLEELFDLPPSGPAPDPTPPTIEETKTAIAEVEKTMDKIDAALPGVRGLDSSDQEMDDLANMAKESYDNLMDLVRNQDI